MTGWIDIDARREIVLHPVFLDFARYWGFTPRLCSAYRAQARGFERTLKAWVTTVANSPVQLTFSA
ncbi:MAG TPA: hypothetical protein VEX68_09000 [Bryobacteraceae bacterium]|nr:hypothetical protein [Bryobacteraceae bacterium]